MPDPLLYLTDGTTKVNLLSGVGFHTQDWTPARPALKDSGIWQSSPLASGRRLMLYKHENAIDTFVIVANHRSQDDLIRECQDADRLLLAAIDYQVSSWATLPVYLVARGPAETNTRYALVHSYALPQDDNPYGQPFWSTFGYLAMDEITLIVEHGPWLELPPGQEACVEISAQQNFIIDSFGTMVLFGREAANTCAGSITGYLLQEDLNNIDLEDGTGSLLLEGGSLTLGEVYVGNKHAWSNLTHIWCVDGGVFGANLVNAMYPFSLTPAFPANGDYLAFGSDVAVPDSGPFSSLVFDIGTENLGTGTVTWEYSSGAGPTWTAIPTADLTDLSSHFTMPGVVSVHWRPPDNWTAVALNGVTAYWVRALIVIPGGEAFTQVVQQNRGVYAVPWGRCEVAGAQVPGDLPAWMHVNVVPRSADSDTTLGFDQLVLGLRSDARGLGFSAYLNAAQEQNPPGVVCHLGAANAWQERAPSPSGWVARTVGLAGSGSDYVLWDFDRTAVDAYRGTYHAYARVQQRAGNASTLVLRLQAGINDNGTYYQLWEGRDSLAVPVSGATTRFDLVDLGRVTLPPTTPPEPIEVMEVRLLLRNTDPGVAADVDVWDLVLMPVDEWAGTFLEPVASTTVDYTKRLEVDSIGDPKRYIKAGNMGRSSGNLIVPYEPITNGPAILQANVAQRLWFLAALNGTADPAICHTVKMARVARYQSMRGAR